MRHMQMEITSKQPGWYIETADGGYCVPEEVCRIPDWFAIGAGVDSYDDADGVFRVLERLIREYVSGDILSIEALRPRYFARLSAPGYLDCTDWAMFSTVKEAHAYLRDL